MLEKSFYRSTQLPKTVSSIDPNYQFPSRSTQVQTIENRTSIHLYKAYLIFFKQFGPEIQTEDIFYPKFIFLSYYLVPVIPRIQTAPLRTLVLFGLQLIFRISFYNPVQPRSLQILCQLAAVSSLTIRHSQKSSGHDATVGRA